MKPINRKRFAGISATIMSNFDDGVKMTEVPDPEEMDLPALKKDPEIMTGGLPDGAFPQPWESVRACKALIYPPARIDGLEHTHAVIFGQGFSLPPKNYESVIKCFQAQGWLVVAPTSTLSIWNQRVELCEPCEKMQAKLQTALILDMIRSAQYIEKNFFTEKLEDRLPPLGEIALCGHSMGGACAFVAASYLKKVKAVGVMASAVRETCASALNQLLHMGSSHGDLGDAVQFFDSQLPHALDVFIVGGRKDGVVPMEVLESLLAAIYLGRGKSIDHAHFFPVDGNHVGFADQVDPDIEPRFWGINLILRLLNHVLYVGACCPKRINFAEQRANTRLLLVNGFASAFHCPVREMPPMEELPKYADTDGQLVNLNADELRSREFPKSVQPNGNQVHRILSAWSANPSAVLPIHPLCDDDPWRESTTLLLSYVAAHSISLVTAASLFYHHFSSSGLSGTTVSLGIIMVFALGLMYENVVLAAGRFIVPSITDTRQRQLLALLNQPRFFFHSAAPVLLTVGANIASHAGIHFVEEPICILALGLLTLMVISVSTIRNALWLETRPAWAAGILHFTYRRHMSDFTRVVPVVYTSTILTVLGFFSALNEPALMPFGIGSAICLALSAGLASKIEVPMILAGNAGEVILLASLVYAQGKEIAL